MVSLKSIFFDNLQSLSLVELSVLLFSLIEFGRLLDIFPIVCYGKDLKGEDVEMGLIK